MPAARFRQRTSCLVDEARPAFGVDVGTGGCACHGGGERVAWQCDGDVAAFDGVAGVGGRHGDLNGGRTDRDIDDDGIFVEVDFVAAAVGAAHNGEHDPLHAMRMAQAITVIAASVPL